MLAIRPARGADTAIELRLANWARWARDRRGFAGRCGSVEGRYVAERLAGDTEDDRRTARTPLDVRLALRVFERINPETGKFPAVLYLVLTAEFVHRMQPWEIRGYLRRHGHPIARHDVDAIVRRAVIEAGRVLR
jgi:hypothetical protein